MADCHFSSTSIVVSGLSQDVGIDERVAIERTLLRDRAISEEYSACWPKDGSKTIVRDISSP